MARPSKDLTGKTFTRLTVLTKSVPGKNGSTRWSCKCACGDIKDYAARHLLNGSIKSCGCYSADSASKRFEKHGHTKGINGKQVLSREFKSWRSMKQRCNDINYTFYKNYGGRGITVCVEWIDNFEQFLRDMGPRPENTTLDRIDNNKGYYPDNCRWADRTTQNLNRRPRGQKNERKKLVQI